MTVKPSFAEQISHLLCALQGTVHRHGLTKRQLCPLLRGRDGSCCVPGPGLFLLHSSFRPLSLPLGLFSLENAALTLASLLSGTSSSAWKQALFSHWAALPPPASHLSASCLSSLLLPEVESALCPFCPLSCPLGPLCSGLCPTIRSSLPLPLPAPHPFIVFWLSSIFQSLVILKPSGLRTS